MRVAPLAMLGALVSGLLGAGVVLLASAAAPSALYVVESGANRLTPVPSGTVTPGTSVAVGTAPQYVAVSPDGTVAFVTNSNSGSVTKVDLTGTNAPVAITVGAGPEGVAVSPDGSLVLVADSGAHAVTPINATTGVAGSAILVGASPYGVAIRPQGDIAYVTDAGSATVTPLILKPTVSAGAPIPVGVSPKGIAITPNGQTAYVVDSGSNAVTPIQTSNNMPGNLIQVGTNPTQIAITPDGSTGIVTNTGSGSVSMILLNSGFVTTINMPPASVGGPPMAPSAVTVTPDGATAWVSSTSSGAVVPLSIPPGGVGAYTFGQPITGFSSPLGVATTPDQAPVASLSASATTVSPGSTITLTASGTVAYGQITAYQFKFGDGQEQVVRNPSPASPVSVTHTYANPGMFVALVYMADSAGTGSETVYTGQTTSRYSPVRANGLPQDADAVLITVTGSSIATHTPVLLAANWGGPGMASGWVTPVGVPQGSVSPVVGSTIPAGNGPAFLAVTPDASAAVVTNYNGATLTPITICPGATSQSFQAGTAVATGPRPSMVAISPLPVAKTPTTTTWAAYVVDGGANDVRSFLLITNPVACTATLSVPSTGGSLPASMIPVGLTPYGIAITPDGSTAYVSNAGSNTVTPVNLANGSAGSPIPVGLTPEGIAISPDGSTVYVVNNGSNSVTPIQTAGNTPGTQIQVGGSPTVIAITPDGSKAFVSNSANPPSVSVIMLASGTTTSVALPQTPNGIVVTPDGATAWVATWGGTLYPIPTATLRLGNGTPGFVGMVGLAMTPDQAPVAQISVSAAQVPVGTMVTFDASLSSVAYGSISAYQFKFGDGIEQVVIPPNPLPPGWKPTAQHTYTSPGTYPAIVFERDSAGTAYSSSFTGQSYSQYAPVQANGVPQDSAGVYVKVTAGTTTTTIATHVAVEYATDLSGGNITPVQIQGSGSPIVGASIPVGKGTAFVAVTPDGQGIVATDYMGNAVVPVAVCDAGTGVAQFKAGSPVADGLNLPAGVAISPKPVAANQWSVFVANLGGNNVHQYLLTINPTACTATLAPVQPVSASIIPVGQAPYGIVITPDGSMAYVTNSGADTVTPIVLSGSPPATCPTGQLPAPCHPIVVGQAPEGVAITGDGKTVYVAANGSNFLTPISTATNTPGTPITVGSSPIMVATTPASTSTSGTVFIVSGSGAVNAVDIGTGRVTVVQMPSGVGASGISVSPDGTTAWATSYSTGALVPISVASDTVISGSIAAGLGRPIGDAASTTP